MTESCGLDATISSGCSIWHSAQTYSTPIAQGCRIQIQKARQQAIRNAGGRGKFPGQLVNWSRVLDHSILPPFFVDIGSE